MCSFSIKSLKQIKEKIRAEFDMWLKQNKRRIVLTLPERSIEKNPELKVWLIKLRLLEMRIRWASEVIQKAYPLSLHSQ